MKKPVTKDIVFVGIQFLLFVIYLTPLFSFEFKTNEFIKYSAFVLAVIGLLTVALAFLQMNKSLTPFPTPKVSGALIQTGLYKYVRHPIYSGIILAALGFGVYRGSVWKMFVGILLWILFYFKSRYEETLLAGRFKEYENYRARTFRFFPFF